MSKYPPEVVALMEQMAEVIHLWMITDDARFFHLDSIQSALAEAIENSDDSSELSLTIERQAAISLKKALHFVLAMLNTAGHMAGYISEPGESPGEIARRN